MKLRLSGNSVRLRLLRSEVAKLMESGCVQETVRFNSNEQAKLTYALRVESGLEGVQLRHEPSEIVIVLATEVAKEWSESDRVGIYSTVDVGLPSALNLVVEKDFACLDRSDSENQDTFPNPKLGAVCSA